MTPGSQAASGRVLSIQHLRAVAALLVFAFHSGVRADQEHAFFVGGAGVDIFFVISGFVMWTVTETQAPSAWTFVRHRLARIVPLYYAVTAIYLAIYVFLPALYPWKTLHAADIVRSLLFHPYYNSDGLIAPIVGLGWTLDIEMFFYAIFAVGLLIPLRWRLAYVTGMLAGLAFAGLFVPEGANAALEHYTHQMLMEFLAGVMIGRLWTTGRIPGLKVGAGLFALGVAALAIDHFSGFSPYRSRVLVWGLPAAALVLGGLAIERAGRLPRLRLAEILGDASYSIYLLHVLVLGVAFKLVGPHPLMLFLVGFVPLCVVSVLSYRLYEKPLNSWLRRAGERRPAAGRTPQQV